MAAFAMNDPNTYIIVACYIVLIYIALLATLQPHKNQMQNKVDLVLLTIVANAYLAILTSRNHIIRFPGGICVLLPLYGLVVLLKKVLPQRFVRQQLEKVHNKILHIIQRRELEESLPYRLEQSEKDPLLAKLIR